MKNGDKIKVHYKGTLLDGTKFDSSYDRAMALPFTVGEGSVIKCWDQGFVGLKFGQKAEFVCPPDYAYGSRSRPKIPAFSTLLFSVLVVDIEKDPVKFSVTVT